MIKKYIIVIVLFIAGNVFSRDWVEVNSSSPSEPTVIALSSAQQSVELSFELSGYFLEKTVDGNKITFPGGVPILEKGSPDLPIITRSIQIPDLAKMELKVVSSNFIDFPMEDIVPSKGNVTRDINIQDVPNEKGSNYKEDYFYIYNSKLHYESIQSKD